MTLSHGALVIAALKADHEGQTVPSWSAFNAAITSAPRESVIGYLLVIASRPTELSTVYELMKRSCETSQHLGQLHTIITLDQAVYFKAKLQ